MRPYEVEVKNEILQKLIEQLEDEQKKTQSSTNRTTDEAREAEGRMKTRYDSTKAELSELANRMRSVLLELSQSLSILRNFKISNQLCQKIYVGSFIELRPLGDEVSDPGGQNQNHQEKEFYFLLPTGGGKSVQIEQLDQEVQIITPQSPIGQALLDKRAGEIASVRSRKLAIVEIF